MSGGYRQGSGRSKSGYYKEIYCGSTYELCWVIYNLDHQIGFDRFPGKLKKDEITYYPDFLLSDGTTIIETKGYEKQESVDTKTRVAEFFGYTVQVLRKDDLHYAFSYVEETYNTKKFHELYDDYKPKYEYSCSFCKTIFQTDRKRNTENIYCCRSCSMKSTASINREENNKKISATLSGRKREPFKKLRKQFWITDSSVNRKIDINSDIPLGFTKGYTRHKNSR